MVPESERFEDPDLDLLTLQNLLGDWWRIPNDFRIPLNFGIQSDHQCEGRPCSGCSVYKSGRKDVVEFREYARLFDSYPERCCLLLDIHSQNSLIMYQVGCNAVHKGAQGAPVDIGSKEPDTAPWSRYM